MISLDKLIQQEQFYLTFLNGNFKTLVSPNLQIKCLICKRASSNDSLLSRQTESVRDHKFHSGMLIHRWFTDRGHFISHLHQTQE